MFNADIISIRCGSVRVIYDPYTGTHAYDLAHDPTEHHPLTIGDDVDGVHIDAHQLHVWYEMALQYQRNNRMAHHRHHRQQQANGG